MNKNAIWSIGPFAGFLIGGAFFIKTFRSGEWPQWPSYLIALALISGFILLWQSLTRRRRASARELLRGKRNFTVVVDGLAVHIDPQILAGSKPSEAATVIIIGVNHELFELWLPKEPVPMVSLWWSSISSIEMIRARYNGRTYPAIHVKTYSGPELTVLIMSQDGTGLTVGKDETVASILARFQSARGI